MERERDAVDAHEPLTFPAEPFLIPMFPSPVSHHTFPQEGHLQCLLAYLYFSQPVIQI